MGTRMGKIPPTHLLPAEQRCVLLPKAKKKFHLLIVVLSSSLTVLFVQCLFYYSDCLIKGFFLPWFSFAASSIDPKSETKEENRLWEKRTQLTHKQLHFLGVPLNIFCLSVYSPILLFSLLCSAGFFKESLYQQLREKIKAPVTEKQVTFCVQVLNPLY